MILYHFHLITFPHQVLLSAKQFLACVGALASLLAGEVAYSQAVVGIFGDSHGDVAIADAAFRQMRGFGVTHLIGTGDYVRCEGPKLLEEILFKLTAITGVAKQDIFLCPGNWDHEVGQEIEKLRAKAAKSGMSPQEINRKFAAKNFTREEVNEVIKDYGDLVFENYDGYGFVQINGEKIMVSHFPQHEVPDEFLGPPEYRKRTEGQAYVMDTVLRGIFPDPDVTFGIFAHTHVGGAFWEKKSGKLVINAGALDMATTGPGEPQAYAIYYQKEREIVFFDAAKGSEISRVSVQRGGFGPGPSCASVLLLREFF